MPPFNILALAILLPLKTIVSPRWFHKVNVAAVRSLNAPLLLLIGLIERRTLWAGPRRQREAEQLPKSRSRAGLWDFSRSFSVHGDISAVFDAEPPESVENEISNDDDIGHHILEDEFSNEFGARPSIKSKKESTRTRRDSVNPFAGLSGQLKNLLREAGDDEDATDVQSRLEALENSTLRIEKMLGRLCEELDDSARRSSSLGGDGGLRDLDKSGTSEIGD